MRKYIILFFATILSGVGYCQNEYNYKDYELWYIRPNFYNNYISDSTEAYYWENYWYFKNKKKNLFPDTLVVTLKAVPSMVLLSDYDSMPPNNYRVKSSLEFKYGNFDNCSV